MKEFLSNVTSIIPGFRSGVKWKKIVAAIYYVVAVLLIFANFWLFLFLLTAPYFVFGLMNLLKAKKAGNAVHLHVLFVYVRSKTTIHMITNDLASGIMLEKNG